LSDTDAEGAELVARNLLDELRRPFAVVGADVHLSASIGISLFPLDARSSEELLKHADTAMYTAKHAGRNNAQMYARSTAARLRSFRSRADYTARSSATSSSFTISRSSTSSPARC
jgi:predicted signal transduction protein with EAL and GGDEF domain